MARVNILSEVTGKVWKIKVSEGDRVKESDEVMIVESMKMEIPVPSSGDGRIVQILVKEGDSIEDGQAVAVLET